MCLVRETEIATMKGCVCVHCTADVLPSTVASHSVNVLLFVGGVTVAQEVCSMQCCLEFHDFSLATVSCSI